MSRLISVEFDNREIRLAIGSTGLVGVSLERILTATVELPEGESALSSEAYGEVFKGVLQQAGIKSGNVVVCVGRGEMELRTITLPKVDSNELPDMVRFAAPRYFANFGDNWPLDFVTLPSLHEGSVECLTGSINPSHLQRIAQWIVTSGLTLDHIVLRPMVPAVVAASKHPEWGSDAVMLVDLLRDEADVVVVQDGNAVFMRSFRWSDEEVDSQSIALLSSEIKRSMLSVNSQRPNLSINRIIVWGNESNQSITSALSESLGRPVESLDPFSLVERSNFKAGPNDGPVGQYAPVIGALFTKQQAGRVIDFLNPRKRIEKKKPYLQYGIAAAVAAGIVGGGVWWYYSSLAAMDQEIAKLNQEIKDEKDLLVSMDKNVANWKKVETFLKGDYPWVDELENLSVKAKDSKDVLFSGCTFNLEPRSNMASISTTFYVKDQDFVPVVHAAYRDKTHSVVGVKVANSPNKEYQWASDLLITLAELTTIKPESSKSTETSVQEVGDNSASSDKDRAAEKKLAEEETQESEVSGEARESNEPVPAGENPDPAAQAPTTAAPSNEPTNNSPLPPDPPPSPPGNQGNNVETKPGTTEPTAAPEAPQPQTEKTGGAV